MQNAEKLYFSNYKKIYNLAYRMTGNKDDASDITQETFIQAFKSIDKFKGESEIYTWLYRIATNKCLRFLDKKKKSSFISLEQLINNYSAPVSEEMSEWEKWAYIQQVKDGCLSGLLRCIFMKQRMVFILHILLGLPVHCVARIIDKSENATRILIHRSKENIKSFLCNNCSLYDSMNKCHCENLISFSLKQNWIDSNNNLTSLKQAESEIKTLKNVVGLYHTLQEAIPSLDFENQMRQILADNKDFLILSSQKVK
jgi:RNA polymerase sigma factor (sigma-70 family)